MEQAEFDKFAEEYKSLHRSNIRASGEDPEYFAEYKVSDTAALIRELGLPDDGRGLDFGTGIGNSLPYFAKHLPRCSLTGLDVSTKSLEIAGQRFPGQAELVCFDGQTLPFADESFDFAFAACVFHHIPEDSQSRLLEELQRVLRPDGLMMVFEHNPYNPLTVRAVNTCPFDENAVLINAARLKQRIRNAGFSNVEHRYRIFFPGPLRSLRRLESILHQIPLGAQYYVSARR